MGEHLGGAVLQSLEGSDHLAELGAGLDVVEGDLEGLQGLAEHFSRQADAGPVQQGIEDGPAAIDSAQDGVLAERYAVKGDLGSAAAVGQGEVFAGDAGGVGRDEEQGQAVGLAGGAAGAGCDDQQVRSVAVDDKGLGSVQGPAAARAVFSGA
jgi:hypothetical protein